MFAFDRFCLAGLVGLYLLASALTSPCAAQTTTLPGGARAVWNLSKAYKETTPTRQRICINGLWHWQPAARMTNRVPGDKWGYHKVPGHWPGVNHYMHRDGQTLYPHPAWRNQNLKTLDMAWYQREIKIPANWTGRRISVYTEYLNSYADVYVDGKKVDSIPFPWGEVDVTGVCKPGRTHVLSLFVVALPLNKTITSYADAQQGRTSRATVARRGLCGDVYLVSTPKGERIGDVKVDTSVRKWEITLDASVRGLKPGRSCKLNARIIDNGREVKSLTSGTFNSARLKDGRFTFTSKWKPDKLWDVHTPKNMYTLRLSLLDSAGKALDTHQPVRFGFREFWTKGRDFYLNGTRFYCFAIPLDNAQMGPYLASYEGAKEAMLRLKKTGINTAYTHNYSSVPGSHLSFEEIMRAADDVGLLISLSQPHARSYKWNASDADSKNGYADHAEFYVRMAQNHPSVVMYSMNHNYMGYTHDMNPALNDGLHNREGRLGPRTDDRARIAKRTENIISRFDRTRVMYHHSSGNLGAMFTSNFYINFVPIQERSDWFEHWATKGVKPMFLVEYGVPLGMTWTLHRGWDKGGFGRGKRYWTNGKLQYQFCTAEWGSQFLGDRSYKLTEFEKADVRFEAKQWRANKTWKRWDYPFRIHQSPLNVPNLDDVQAMYITDNWRSYRTWGLSAFNIWGYGSIWTLKKTADKGRKNFRVDWDNIQKPGYSVDYIDRRYDRMDTAYRESDWELTNAAKALMRNNQPLLAYIGGKPARFTSKDHNFLPGETVAKQLIVINNSRETVTCNFSWSLGLPQPVAGRKVVTVKTGEREYAPVNFVLPANLAAGKYTLTMTAKFSSGETQTDTFDIHVMAASPNARALTNVALFDPKGETRKLLVARGVRFTSVNTGSNLTRYDTLIVGKGALTLTGPAPNITRVRDGLKVIFFEQTREVLEQRFGFRVQEYGLRRVFERIPGHSLLAGLRTESLRDWKGQATLVPHFLDYRFNYRKLPSVRWCGYEVSRGWRAGCWGNVASVLIEKPSAGDYLPIVDGGFNLQYSPLMEYREGSGMVLFCQMDVSGRTEDDPAAAQLTSNIFNYVAAWKPTPRRQALYAGDPAGLAHLKQAGITVGNYAGGALKPDQVLIVGPGGGRRLVAHKGAIGAWLDAGGHLLTIGLDANEANSFLPIRIASRKVEHISAFFEPTGPDSPLAGIGPAEVLLRDPQQIPLITGGADVIGNGVLATAKGGRVVLCQLVPWKFDTKRYHHTKLSFRRTSFLVSRLAANMGVSGSSPVIAQVARPVRDGMAEARWLKGIYLDKPVAFDDPYRFFRW